MISLRQDKWIEHRWSGITAEQRKEGRSRLRKMPALKVAYSRRLWEKIRRRVGRQTVSRLWRI
mgnify:CR=1 FL=1